MARATQWCLCIFCWFKTLFSFLTLENGWGKTSAARILQRAEVRSALPGPNSTPDNSIEVLLSIGHRYLPFLSPAAAPCYPAAADFLCPRPGCFTPPSPLLCSQELHGKEANCGKCFEFLRWNLHLLVCLFFSAVEKSRILKTFWSFLQICGSFPWLHEWCKGARTVNSSHSLAAQWAVKSCWSH